MERGYVHIYTGNGKGKTTAALGLALRAAGAGKRVWIGQFAKGCEYAEHTALKRFDDLITVRQFGEPAFIRGKPGQEDIVKAQKGLKEAKKAMTEGEYQVVVLDEACIALHFAMFTVDALIQAVNDRADGVEILLTGRNAPDELIDAADLVTEMREIKHYYTRGVPARVGIEK